MSDLCVELDRNRVLSKISFSIEGGMVLLVGPNGAGKSVLLRTLATLIEPKSGSVVVGGIELTRKRRRLVRSNIAYVEQETRFPSGRATVRDVLEYSAWLHRLRGLVASNAISDVSGRFGLRDTMQVRVGALSGGTRQRLAIAQSMMRRPPVILLDEPTVGVDTEHRASFRSLLKELANETSVIMATHLPEDVDLLGDRLIALRRGRLVFDGGRADFFAGVSRRPGVNQFESAMAKLSEHDSADKR